MIPLGSALPSRAGGAASNTARHIRSSILKTPASTPHIRAFATQAPPPGQPPQGARKPEQVEVPPPYSPENLEVNLRPKKPSRTPSLAHAINGAPDSRDSKSKSSVKYRQKVSNRNGPDSLFLECLDQVRNGRRDLQDAVSGTSRAKKGRAVVDKLSLEETVLVNKVFRKVELNTVELETPDRAVDEKIKAEERQQKLVEGDNYTNSKAGRAKGARSIAGKAVVQSTFEKQKALLNAKEEHKIDPYWDPFHEVAAEESKLEAEFEDYSKFVSVAEAKKQRMEIRRSIRASVTKYDPLKHWDRNGRVDEPPQPGRLHEKFWQPSATQRRMNMEYITWKDVDILQHQIAPNGWILPRRTTMLGKKQQHQMSQAVNTARCMAVLPFEWKPPDYNSMPMMDPLQFLADRLTMDIENERSRAMLEAMMVKYPKLNYRVYFKWKKHVMGKARNEGQMNGRMSNAGQGGGVGMDRSSL